MGSLMFYFQNGFLLAADATLTVKQLALEGRERLNFLHTQIQSVILYRKRSFNDF